MYPANPAKSLYWCCPGQYQCCHAHSLSSSLVQVVRCRTVVQRRPRGRPATATCRRSRASLPTLRSMARGSTRCAVLCTKTRCSFLQSSAAAAAAAAALLLQLSSCAVHWRGCSADARAFRQVGPVWDGGSDETQGEWQSKVDNADVLIMGESALVGLWELPLVLLLTVDWHHTGSWWAHMLKLCANCR